MWDRAGVEDGLSSPTNPVSRNVPGREGTPLVFHYTKAPTAIEHILATSRIKLTHPEDFNDPWERREVGILTDSSKALSAERACHDEVARVMRGARVACFAQDEPAEVDEHEPRACVPPLPGWAMDRMWAQYADNHKGICLAFRRAELVSRFRDALGRLGQCWAKAVTYSPWDGRVLARPSAAEARAELAAAATRFVIDHEDYLYFTKRKDWAGEREFRLAYLGRSPNSDPCLLSIEGCVEAIYVGARFSEAYRPCIENACRRLNVRAFRVGYTNTLVSLPFYDPSGGGGTAGPAPG